MWNIPNKERLETIPKLYETDHISLKNKKIYLHFFLGNCDWFACEFDGDDRFFGFAVLNGDLQMAEWGMFSFSELKSIRIDGRFEVDCEAESFWRIRPSRHVKLICEAQGWRQELLRYENQNV
jgi:hypothetical protein